MRAVHPISILSLAFLLACGPVRTPDDDPPDASVQTVDAGEVDAGEVDAGEVDAGQACDESTCAGCCNAEGECVDGLDVDACGQSGVACEACSFEEECRAGSCEVPLGPIEGDSCESVLELTPVGGVARRYISLSNHADDARSSCGTSAYADAVVSFEVLDEDTRVTLSVSSNEFGVTPVVSLRGQCAGAEAACAAGIDGTAEFTKVLQPGVWFAWVEAIGAPTGSLLVEATFTPTATSETCEEATSLHFNDSGSAVTSVPLGNVDDFSLDCLGYGTSGADSAYRVHVESPSDFHASVRNDRGYPYSSVIALRSACGGENLGCGVALDLANLEPGDYWLLRDSSTSEEDPLTLLAKLTPHRPEGETCARAIPLSISGGTAQATGDLTGATDDVDGYCSSVSGRDHVYSFTLDAPQRVSVTASRTSGSGALSLRLMNPGRCASGSSMGCNTGASASLTELLAAGTYLLAVDSDTVGEYAIELEARTPADGESCANPVAFTFPAGGGTQSHQASTIGSTQENHNNACMGYDRPDHVYRVVTTDPLSNLSVVSTPIGTNNAPGMMLVEACNQIVPLEKACGLTEATRELQHTALPAGEWFVWVKGASVQGTDYQLDFTVTPTPDGDTCSNAFPLALSEGTAGGTVSVQGDTTGAAHDFLACSQVSPAFSDEVYEFTIDRELDLRARLTTADGARGALTMLEEDCTTDSICARHDGEDTRLKVSSLQPGTHRFSVDHVSGGPGAYTLDVELAAHRPGETCGNPIPLALSDGAAGGTARVTSDLRDFIDDSVDCYGRGGDVFYSFTTDRTLDVRVAVEAGEALGTVDIGLFSSCDAAATCETIYSSNGFAQGSVPAGTYVIVVDADYPRDEGVVTLDVSLTPPTPGDTCEVAIPLDVPATGGAVQVQGSTANAFNFHRNDCGTYYPDRVYTFTTTKTLSLIARATNAAGSESHALTLRSACDSSSIACTKGGGAQSIVRAAELPAGTYHLFVDKFDYDSPDDYTLDVTLGPRPAGDVCDSALPLGLPSAGAGEVIVQGDSRPFFHDVTTSCGASSAKEGADVLYAFTTTAKMNLRLLVDAETEDFRPTVSLRSGCGEFETDLRCGWVPTFATDAWASYEDLPAGNWFVSVDGYDTTQSGAFELVARLSESMAGDTCENPYPLALSGGGRGTATATGQFADFFEHYSDCWNNSGSDVVYRVTTDAPRRLHAMVEVSERTAGATVSVRNAAACGSSSGALACERPSYDGTGRVSADLPAGTSYVVVKSPLAKPTGTFDLTVRVDDFEPGDVCDDAIPLAFSGGVTSATLDPYEFGQDAVLRCDSDHAPDAFFTFTTGTTKDLSVTLTADDTRGYALSLRPGCAGAEAECVSRPFQSGLTLERPNLPAGTWVLVVQGGTTRPSSFTLDATLTTP